VYRVHKRRGYQKRFFPTHRPHIRSVTRAAFRLIEPQKCPGEISSPSIAMTAYGRGAGVGRGLGVGFRHGTLTSLDILATKLPIAIGPLPTGTVATTVLVEVSITETLLLSKFATYTRVPSGFTVMPSGSLPTVIVSTTV
jgi:hypothetical protein